MQEEHTPSKFSLNPKEDLYYSIENKSFLGEHKVITPKQQFLGIILCFFVFKMAVAITFLCKNAVEAI